MPAQICTALIMKRETVHFSVLQKWRLRVTKCWLKGQEEGDNPANFSRVQVPGSDKFIENGWINLSTRKHESDVWKKHSIRSFNVLPIYAWGNTSL